MRSILVTGGAGYIGSMTCKLLAKHGYELTVVDNLSTGYPEFAKWGKLERLDLNDRESLSTLFKKKSFEAVIHFAAHAYVGESVTDPEKYYRNNLSGTISLLSEMKKVGCKKIVFSSSCATYGIPKKVPISENEAQNPINPYGRSKWMVEQILRDFENAYDFSSASLRYFNAAGADPEGEIGEDHRPETHLIPNLLRAIEGEPVSIFGEDYETADGTCVRDFIHVADLASAHIKALEYLGTNPGNIELNLGTGTGYSVKEAIRAVQTVVGRAPKVKSAARRPGDPPVLVAHASESHKILQWKPAFPGLEIQIEHAWKWLQKRGS